MEMAHFSNASLLSEGCERSKQNSRIADATMFPGHMLMRLLSDGSQPVVVSSRQASSFPAKRIRHRVVKSQHNPLCG